MLLNGLRVKRRRRAALRVFVSSAILAIALAAQAAPRPSQAGETRQGLKVHMMEDHSQVLPLCLKMGLRDLDVLHVDAHDDLWPPPSPAQVERAAALLRSRRYDKLEAAGLFFAPRRQRLYNINNFAAMGHKLGVFREVYWAYPVLGSLNASQLAELKAQIGAAGQFPAGEVEKLEIRPPHLSGTLSGVPVTIGSLRDFTPPAGPYVLSVCLDFFPMLYKNPVASSYTGLLSGFVDFVTDANRRPPVLTAVSFSHNGGYVPVSLRFVGRWLQKLLSTPRLLRSDPPRSWTLKEEALHQAYFDQAADAGTLYDEIIRIDPSDSDAHYSRGLLLIGDRFAEGVRSLTRAYRLDPVYIQGFLDAAAALERAGQSRRMLEVLRAAERLDPKSPLVLDLLGNYFHNRGDYGKAARYYSRIIKSGAASPLTYAYLGDSYRLSGKLRPAEDAYAEATAFHRESPDTLLPPVYWRHLGEVRETMNLPAKALAAYREFLARRPPADSPDTRFVKERVEALTNSRTPVIRP